MPRRRQTRKPRPEELLARFIAHQAVRNGILEEFHAGVAPSSEAGDFSDVEVRSPYGTIPWNRVSRISDPELRRLMLQVEQGIARCLVAIDAMDDAEYAAFLARLEREYFGPGGISWDRPRAPGADG